MSILNKFVVVLALGIGGFSHSESGPTLKAVGMASKPEAGSPALLANEAPSRGGVLHAIMVPLREPTKEETVAFREALSAFKQDTKKGEALAAFLEKNPGSPWAGTASMALGMVYRDGKDTGKAIAAFRKAKDLFSKAMNIRGSQGMVDWAGIEADELEAGSRANLRKRLGGVTVVPEVGPKVPMLRIEQAVGLVKQADTHNFLPSDMSPTQQPTVAETQDLVKALETYFRSGDSRNYTPLTEYLKQHPESPWRAGLNLSLARACLWHGRQEQALDYLITAEQLARPSGSGMHPKARALAYASYDQLRDIKNIPAFTKIAENKPALNQKYATAVSSATHSYRQFEWDAENRLASVTIGNKRTEFGYDPLGRRAEIIEKEINNGQVTITADRKFIWDGPVIAEERGGADGSIIVKRFFPQGFIDTDGTKLYYTFDHLGSVRELVDEAQQVRARYEYDPWGNVTKIFGDRSSDILYTGHFWHPQSQLYLTLNRAYDPGLGRWLSRDPEAEAGGLNLYAYAYNNPINYADITGLTPLRLPNTPSGLPPGWQLDPTHRDPNGERWRSPNGDDYLDFHKGKPGEPGWGGKDHWHDNGSKKHRKPGDEVPISDPDGCPSDEKSPDAKERNLPDWKRGWPGLDPDWDFKRTPLGIGFDWLKGMTPVPPSPSTDPYHPGCPICGGRHW